MQLTLKALLCNGQVIIRVVKAWATEEAKAEDLSWTLSLSLHVETCSLLNLADHHLAVLFLNAHPRHCLPQKDRIPVEGILHRR